MSNETFVSHSGFRAEAPKTDIDPEAMERSGLQNEKLRETAGVLGHSAIETTVYIENEATKRNELITQYMDVSALGNVPADVLVEINKRRESSVRDVLFSLAHDTDQQTLDVRQGRRALTKLVGRPTKILFEDEREEQLMRTERMIRDYVHDPAYDLSDQEYPGRSQRQRSGQLHDLVQGMQRSILIKRDRFGAR